jgi:X-X-X-Leu-X-X-Gly heptad repeat protein
VLGPKLRGLGVLGVKLGAGLLRIGLGAWLAGGLNEGREPIDGLEGIDGAGAGRLNDGLGALKDGLDRLKDGLGWLNEGLGRLVPTDGLELLENDLCMLDIRSAIIVLPDLSRPSSRLPAIGEISVAATTAATTACDLIIFLVNILLLLGPPNVTAASGTPITGCLHLSQHYKSTPPLL